MRRILMLSAAVTEVVQGGTFVEDMKNWLQGVFPNLQVDEVFNAVQEWIQDNLANIGGSIKLGPGKIIASYGRAGGIQNFKADLMAVGYDYSLSKRTNLYSSYARVRNNNLGVFGMSSAGGSFAPPSTAFGADPSTFNVGVRHSF